MTFLQTAAPHGKVHLIRPNSSITLCGRVAQKATVKWPRWSPSDRGVNPIQRESCTKCSDAAALVNKLYPTSS